MSKTPKKPKSKVTFIRLPLDLHEKAADLAASDNRTVSNMLATLVREAIIARTA